MNQNELLNLAEKYQKKADRDYRNYQATGITRYETSYSNHNHLASALTIAARSAEEHTAFIEMKAQVSDFAKRAQRLNYSSEYVREKLTQSFLKDLIEYAVLHGLAKEL